MKKLNAQELVKEFNQLRNREKGKTYTGKDLDTLLQKYGFNLRLLAEMKKAHVFISFRSGATKLFQFKEHPLFIDKMEEILKNYRTNVSKPKEEVPVTPEDSALNLLKSKGYSIKKCLGFDEKKFAEDHPELYKKYLIYKDI